MRRQLTLVCPSPSLNSQFTPSGHRVTLIARRAHGVVEPFRGVSGGSCSSGGGSGSSSSAGSGSPLPPTTVLLAGALPSPPPNRLRHPPPAVMETLQRAAAAAAPTADAVGPLTFVELAVMDEVLSAACTWLLLMRAPAPH